jgi:murein DD-endopeptidase MepM/ murein hydrolase activator NlpD
MISRSTFVSAIVLAVLHANGGLAYSQGHRPLKVSLAPLAIRPGDVARVEIDAPPDTAGLSAHIFDRDLPFEYDEQHKRWRALVGVDLDTKPATYSMRIDGSSGVLATQSVTITPRTFRVRRLRVAPKFVEPPPEVLEQIALDSKLLGEVYARKSPKQWTGAFVLPIDTKPNSNFGTRSYYNGQPRSPHAGVDFTGATGTPIRAAHRGIIALAAPLYFTGNTIVIDHGNSLFSIFAHLSEFNVKAGDVVEQKAIVGLVGATGRVTGPHLHWSVRLNGARVDPLSLVAITAQ